MMARIHGKMSLSVCTYGGRAGLGAVGVVGVGGGVSSFGASFVSCFGGSMNKMENYFTFSERLLKKAIHIITTSEKVCQVSLPGSMPKEHQGSLQVR